MGCWKLGGWIWNPEKSNRKNNYNGPSLVHHLWFDWFLSMHHLINQAGLGWMSFRVFCHGGSLILKGVGSSQPTVSTINSHLNASWPVDWIWNSNRVSLWSTLPATRLHYLIIQNRLYSVWSNMQWCKGAPRILLIIGLPVPSIRYLLMSYNPQLR